MHDLEQLRNATHELSVVVVPKHQIRLTTQQLFTSIDRLRQGVDSIPLVIEKLEKADETRHITADLHGKLEVCK